MSTRIGTVASREPVSLAFCCLSLVGLVLWIAVPAVLPYIALFPEYVTRRGYVWTLVTYVALPGTLIHFLVVSVSVLWLGWYIEPALGRIRYIALVVGAALGSGVTYVLAQPTPAPPLIGGLFIASAVGLAFIVWSVPHRAGFGTGLKVFWVLAAIWILYTLWASPVYLVAVHVVAWAIGAFVAASVRQVYSSRNKTSEQTR